MAEEADVCPGCGHSTTDTHDRKTSGKWAVEEKVCQACVVAEAARDNLAEEKPHRRGVYVYTMPSS